MQTLETTLDALLQRMDKELGRIDPRSQTSGTEYVGGIAKFGACLDVYLGAVLDGLCASERLDVRDAIARSRCRQRDRAKLAAGEAAWVLASLKHLPSAQSPVVRTLMSQLYEGSALSRAIHMRNKIIHQREDVTPAEQHATLRALREVLGVQRAELARAASL